jgi:hypothetical protein
MILTMNLILAFLLDFLYDLFADWEMYIRNVYKKWERSVMILPVYIR